MTNNSSFIFKAAIIDMDGVITQTAMLHAKAWKEMFDAFLKKKQGSDFQELTIEGDYKKYIDGIPRFDGVRRFLRSRNISIPEGDPEDDPDQESIYGLGMKKNKLFLELLEKEGVHVFPDSLEMIRKWKKNNIKLAVISSSRNCKYIIESAGISSLFDVRVDGETSEKENLKGKPEADIFLRAAELLKEDVKHSIVIEDAILGVEAGRKGKFGKVIGVARNGEEKELKAAGADIVIKELTELNDKLSLWETAK